MTAPPQKQDSRDVALFLDVDGTLVEIEEHPQAVHAEAELVNELEQVADSLGGALALISGRALADLDRMFRPAVFAAAGAHGTEMRLHGGSLHAADVESLPADVVAEVERFVARHEGLLLEHKTAGLSLHYRQAPAMEGEARRFVDGVMRRLGTEYRLIDGKKVLEIAPRAHSKGEAIRTFMDHAPFGGRRPVFVGDDVTDEDGFRAVNELGGLSIRVGELDGSVARYTLSGVADVRRWLCGAFVRKADRAAETPDR